MRSTKQRVGFGMWSIGIMLVSLLCISALTTYAASGEWQIDADGDWNDPTNAP
jgi:hypothetical protein